MVFAILEGCPDIVRLRIHPIIRLNFNLAEANFLRQKHGWIMCEKNELSSIKICDDASLHTNCFFLVPIILIQLSTLSSQLDFFGKRDFFLIFLFVPTRMCRLHQVSMKFFSSLHWQNVRLPMKKTTFLECKVFFASLNVHSVLPEAKC